jgi:hypothetical protein
MPIARDIASVPKIETSDHFDALSGRDHPILKVILFQADIHRVNHLGKVFIYG